MDQKPPASSTPADSGQGGNDFNSMLQQMDKFFSDIFLKKMPAFPQGLKDFLVKAAPYLVILGLILSGLALLSVLGITGLAASAMPFMAIYGYEFYLNIAALIATVVFEALALPGLFARTLKGWTWLYYSVLANAVFSLLTLNILGLIIGTGLGLWVLYQVKSSYK